MAAIIIGLEGMRDSLAPIYTQLSTILAFDVFEAHINTMVANVTKAEAAGNLFGMFLEMIMFIIGVPLALVLWLVTLGTRIIEGSLPLAVSALLFIISGVVFWSRRRTLKQE